MTRHQVAVAGQILMQHGLALLSKKNARKWSPHGAQPSISPVMNARKDCVPEFIALGIPFGRNFQGAGMR